jgi:hypothetical protein
VQREVTGKSFTVPNTTEDMAMSGSGGSRGTHWVVGWAEYSTTAHQAARLLILVRINYICFEGSCFRTLSIVQCFSLKTTFRKLALLLSSGKKGGKGWHLLCGVP